MGKHRKIVDHCLWCHKDIRKGRGIPENKERKQWCGWPCCNKYMEYCKNEHRKENN